MHYTDESGDIYHFKLLRGGNSQTYVHCKGNHTQIYYLWIKTTLDQPQLPLAAGLQQSSMFNEDAMCVYNKVIGDGFMSHGGLELAKVCMVLRSSPVACCYCNQLHGYYGLLSFRK